MNASDWFPTVDPRFHLYINGSLLLKSHRQQQTTPVSCFFSLISILAPSCSSAGHHPRSGREHRQHCSPLLETEITLGLESLRVSPHSRHAGPCRAVATNSSPASRCCSLQAIDICSDALELPSRVQGQRAPLTSDRLDFGYRVRPYPAYPGRRQLGQQCG
jgi:hypothetical protein